MSFEDEHGLGERRGKTHGKELVKKFTLKLEGRREKMKDIRPRTSKAKALDLRKK